MELQDILKKRIGNKEVKSLEPKDVTVVGLCVDDVAGKKGSKNEGKVVGQKLGVLCKHPDKEEAIKISSIKYIKGDSVKTMTLWVNVDEDDNIQKGSSVALLLEKYGVETIEELEKKTLKTDLDGDYLCLKCY